MLLSKFPNFFPYDSLRHLLFSPLDRFTVSRTSYLWNYLCYLSFGTKNAGNPAKRLTRPKIAKQKIHFNQFIIYVYFLSVNPDHHHHHVYTCRADNCRDLAGTGAIQFTRLFMLRGKGTLYNTRRCASFTNTYAVVCLKKIGLTFLS